MFQIVNIWFLVPVEYVNVMLAEFFVITIECVYNSFIPINAITGAFETYN